MLDPNHQSLLNQRVYLGTSSWKYAGWKNLVYQDHYNSEKHFNETCLVEYARHYPAVGVDHTYYAWPSPKTFAEYCAQTPDHFRFGLKATERCTVFQFPKHRRYGKDAGTLNPNFLNPELFIERFLTPLEPYKHRLGPIMFEFSQFFPGTLASGGEFTQRLGTFLQRITQVPGFDFGVEMRNKNWLQPPYFATLAKFSVSHVFNSWTRMPSIGEQLVIAKDFRPPSYIARLLLEPGTKYEEAVEAYAPYDHIEKALPDLRRDTTRLIHHAIEIGVPAFVYVNNRSEGCAPKTIEAIVESVRKTEAKRSE